MIYKSYLIEKNLNLLEKKIILFYGENLGQKNDFKNKIKKNIRAAEIVHYNQEDLIKNEELFFNEILNISLFNEKKIFFINQANDKILELIKKIETRIDTQKIFLFCELLEKKSKIINQSMKTLEDENKNPVYTYKIKKGISTIKGGVSVLRNLDYPENIIKMSSDILEKI